MFRVSRCRSAPKWRTVAGVKCQNTTFHAQGKSKAVVHVLSELERGAFGESDVWDHFPIAVPPVPPSSLPKCNIIDMDYSIVVIMDISHFNCRGTGLEII